MAGISSKAAGVMQNKEKTFQGQKFDDDLGINYYSFKWRNHDPQIGRFIEIDPLSEDYEYNSSYAFSENKVTSHVELEGLEAMEVAKLIYDNVADGLYRVGEWLNDNLNPAVPAVELATGKSNESNFTEPKPRLQSAAELATFAVPTAKAEAIIANEVKNVVVGQIEKQVINKVEGQALKTAEKQVVGKEVIHGNSKASTKTTTLYKLETKDGQYLKTGITSKTNPEKRYTNAYMKDKKMIPLDQGSRVDMLKKERKIVETNPGPLNKERWAGTKQ